MVFSDFKDSGFRPSEAIIVNVIILLGSAALLFGFDLGITEVEAAVLATGAMSVIGIILRFRSSGGESKLKVEVKEAKAAKDNRLADILRGDE